MNIRQIVTFTFLSVFIVGLSACERVSEMPHPAAPEITPPRQELSIGVVLPLTGRFAEAFGTFAFDANGDAVYAPEVLIVKAGQLVRF